MRSLGREKRMKRNQDLEMEILAGFEEVGDGHFLHPPCFLFGLF